MSKSKGEFLTVSLLESKNYDEKYFNKLIKTLNLKNRLNHLPNEISGGQQQRASIGRALINKPKILFADEPTASLDQKTAKDVIDIFSELNQSTAIVCATHDTAIIPDKARKLYLKDGNIIEGDEKNV